MNGRESVPVTKGDLRRSELRLIAKIEANADKIERVEKRLTERIGANAVKIKANAGKIESVEKRLTEKIEANAEKIEANGQKIEGNGCKIEENAQKIDKLTALVLENRDRIEQMVTRDEFNRRIDEVMNSLDALTGFFSRLNGERAVTSTRLEGDVEKNKIEIKRIKTKLGLN